MEGHMAETVIAAAFGRVKVKSPNARLKDYALEAIDGALGGSEPDAPTDDSDAQQRLRELAKMAITLSNLNIDAACGLFLTSLMDDAPALNALMASRVRPAALDFLHKVFNEEFAGKGVRVKEHPRAKPGDKNGGQSQADAQLLIAANGGGQKPSEAHVDSAPAALAPERIAAAKTASSIRANSLLRSIMINGVPLAKCTAAEVLRSAERDAHLGRFKRRLVEGVAPSVAEYMVIGDIVDDEMAERLWTETKDA
jgi:hypothetical protein